MMNISKQSTIVNCKSIEHGTWQINIIMDNTFWKHYDAEG